METSLNRRGKCCAGNLCIFVNMQLRNCHICTCCKQVVHLLCAVVDKKDDSHICKLCYEKRDKDQGLLQNDQESIKHNEFSNLNTQQVSEVNNTSSRNTKNKRYPNETPEEREVRLKRRRIQEAKRREKVRKNETPENADKRRSKCRERDKKRRSNETPENRDRRLSTDRVSTAQRRQEETAEERAQRLNINRVSTAQRRQEETAEERAQRINTDRVSTAQRRQEESAEERAQRLNTDRVSTAQRRQEESAEERAQRLNTDRVSTAQRRQVETAEERAQRINTDRVSTAQRRQEESAEERAQRINTDRVSTAQRRQEESAEERAQRLTSLQETNFRRREYQRREEVTRNEQVTEDNHEALNQELIRQYEENYDDGVIPNEQRRKFGDLGDMFYECEHCGALKMKQIHRFQYAKGEDHKTFCCSGGEVKICAQTATPLAEELIKIWTEGSVRGRVLRKYGRQINSAFAMASFKSNKEIVQEGYNPSYIIQGTPYMHFGALHAPSDTQPRFAQIYLYDPANIGDDTRVEIRMNHMRLPASMSIVEKRVLKDLVKLIEDNITHCNSYVADFLKCKDINDEDLGPETRIIFHDDAVPSGEHVRRYNSPGLTELCIAATDLEYGIPPLIVRHRTEFLENGKPKLQLINNCSSIYDRLFFVLLFPDGGKGWHHKMKCKHDSEKKLTLNKYNRYLLQERKESVNAIMQGAKVMQQFAVMTFARDESHKLQYHRQKVNKKRQANYRDLLQNVNINNGEGSEHGKKVMLSSSYYGGVRWYRKKNMESLSIFRRKRKPDLFITITCDPNHQDIQNSLPRHQKAEDRPDIVSRVFKQHLQEITEMLINGAVEGWESAKALIEVVEFQKRGLPHAHILVTLNRDHSITADEIENYCIAEIPPIDSERNYDLWKQVTSKMIHQPCGEFNPTASCCKRNGKCEKYFPKEYSSRSYFDSDGKAIYKRRSPDEGGETAYIKKGDQTLKIDNQWVVPYNPFLLRYFKCHINVEIVSSLAVVKYLLWYPFKGDPRVMASVRNAEDEIATFEDMRTIGPSEALWRIYGFGLHNRYPACLSLPVHLHRQQQVYFEEDDDLVAMMNEQPKDTQLTAFYKINQNDPDGPNQNITYVDFPEKYTWISTEGKWKKKRNQSRTIKSETIGRLPLLDPSMGDIFYLKLLLTHDHCKGVQSEQELRTVQGYLHNTCKDACIALGILEDEQEWDECLNEIEDSVTPKRFRNIFATLVIENSPTHVEDLFVRYHLKFVEDYTYTHIQYYGSGLESDDCWALSLFVMHQLFKEIALCDNPTEKYRLPNITDEQVAMARRVLNNIEGTPDGPSYQEDNINPEIIQESTRNYETLNNEQKTFCDEALETILGDNYRQFLGSLDAVAGTGKTFTLNVLIAKLKTAGKKIFSAAYAGIAGTLLIGGSTFHSQTNAPQEPTIDMVLGIERNTEKCKRIMEADVFVFDESSQKHKWYLEAFDRLLRELTRIDLPFGKKHVVMGSDYGQCLPIVEKANQATQFRMSIKQSELWGKFKKYKLTKNERCADENWRNLLLKVRSGNYPSDQDGNINLPQDITECNINAGELQDEMVKFVYEGIEDNFEDPDWFKNRCILCPHNESSAIMNDRVMDLIPGEETISYSADSPSTHDEYDDVPVEFLNSLNYPGYPKHSLRLKKNMIMMLLRNINKKRGLCNGTRLILKNIKERTLECYNPGRREMVDIPRIRLKSDIRKGGFSWTRLQYPVQPAFAMTINKAQGQTFKGNVGVYLHKDVFSHGQLYVALSRVTDPRNIRVGIKQDGKTKNIVLKKALE